MCPHHRLKFLNAQTTDGKTALMLAVVKGWRDIVFFLCSTGADVDLPDKTLRSTPLHWAGACLMYVSVA